MADQSTNIPWSQGMNYGLGVNLLNGDIAGKAVDPGAITGPTQAGGQTTSYNLTLINSFEELYSSLGISVDAGGQYGLFSASGKFSYAKESNFNSQSTFLLARCVVENAFTQIEDPQIRPDASDLLRQGKADLYQQRYGDGFVRGMQTGGEFFAVISLTSTSKEEQESIAASLQAQYGELFASVEVNASLDSKTKSKLSGSTLSVSTYQRGGTGDDQSLTADIESVMARLKAFPAQVKNNPVPYDVQVASYNTLALPEGPNPIDIQAQKDALVDYARIHLKLLSLRNDIEFLQLHPEFFENPPDSATLDKWQDFVVSEINQLVRQASTCVDNPVGGCPILPFQLPPDFRQVQRKLLNSIDIEAAARSWPNNVVMRNVDNTPKDFTVSTRLVTQFTQQTVPGYFGVGLVLASTTSKRCVFFLKGVGNTGQSISCYAFNVTSGNTQVSRVGSSGVLYSDDVAYLQMSKKGDQLLNLSFSQDGQNWTKFAEFIDLTSIGFAANDSYRLVLSAYSTEAEPVSGTFFDTNVTQI